MQGTKERAIAVYRGWYEGQDPPGEVPYKGKERDEALSRMPGDSAGRDWALSRRDGRAARGKRSKVLVSYRRYQGDTEGESAGGSSESHGHRSRLVKVTRRG